MDADVTRGEFQMLVNQVNANATRLDSIDQGGTRGVGVIQTQLTDLAKDVAALSARLDLHEKDHVEEARERARQHQSTRRFVIGSVIAAAGAVGGLYGFLVEIASRVH